MSQRILVTGANRGLGLELARQLIASGHEVWGSARDADPQALLALGPAGAIRMDVGDETSVVAGMAALADRIDGLDLLINNAGVDARAFGADGPRGPFDLDAETFTAVTRINATGPMLVTREALALLRAGGRDGKPARVLNISSQLGSMEVGATMGNDTAYCVSKAALNMFTVKAAAALGPEGIVTVMAHPGWVQTDMGGAAASLTPTESAAGLLALADRLGPDDNGKFFRWDGSIHPW